MMIILLVLIIVGVYFFVSSSGRRKAGDFISGREVSALDIIKERYAEGEITLAEYEVMKKAILDGGRNNE